MYLYVLASGCFVISLNFFKKKTIQEFLQKLREFDLECSDRIDHLEEKINGIICIIASFGQSSFMFIVTVTGFDNRIWNLDFANIYIAFVAAFYIM